MQNDINTEMRAVLDKYIKGYFEPAVDNIRYNNGGSSLDQELISRVCRDILEEVSQLCVHLLTCCHGYASLTVMLMNSRTRFSSYLL